MHDSINRIGIMSVVHEGKVPFGLQTYFFEDMVRYSDVNPEALFFFSPLDWTRSQSVVPGYNFIEGKWIKTSRDLPGIIYDRAFSKEEDDKNYIEQFRNFLKSSDAIVLNPLALAELLNNKVAFHTFLQHHNIPTLSTLPFHVIEDEQFFEDAPDTAYYLKPTFGSKGEGIFVVERKEEVYHLYDQFGNEECFDTHAALMKKLDTEISQKNRYFIQEKAKTILYHTSPFDIRVLVQNYGDRYEVTGKAVRIGQKKAMTSNLNSGGSAVSMDEMEGFFLDRYMHSLSELHLQIENLCLDCSKVLRKEVGPFCEIGFDILLTEDKGPIIIEANAKPSRWVFVKIADHLKALGKDNSYYINRRKETVSVPMRYAEHLNQTRKNH